MHDKIRLNLNGLKNIPAANSSLKTQHAAIYDAIHIGQPAAARAAAQPHIDFVRETRAQSLRAGSRREAADRRLQSKPPK